VNGVPADSGEGQNISEYLDEHGYDQRVIVIGLNDRIVPKSHYASTTLNDGDTLEILHFINGG
jgi:thiamine biosynthesis protein ThiS